VTHLAANLFAAEGSLEALISCNSQIRASRTEAESRIARKSLNRQTSPDKCQMFVGFDRDYWAAELGLLTGNR
jgi:hypothetical protein